MKAKTGRAGPKRQKRVLIVEDSATVRELERKLLVANGYLADVAVDGLDGWNAAQNGNYDLIITDVDMPRMDGIELASRIKQNVQLKRTPVMIVSYKDREQDRMRGLGRGRGLLFVEGNFPRRKSFAGRDGFDRGGRSVRIAIVNDMTIAIEAMRLTLSKARGHELEWVARTGVEAVVERCAQDTPDLVLMDLLMPEMDGIEATRRIMARNPCAIVVVTASVNRNSSKVFEAMGAGALDAVKTHHVCRTWRGNRHAGVSGQDTDHQPAHRRGHGGQFAVGGRSANPACSGGPCAAGGDWRIGGRAGGVGRDFLAIAGRPPAAILVVQHVDAQFAGGLAEWLARQTKLRVRLAREGDEPAPGTVLLAGANKHFVFTGRRAISDTWPNRRTRRIGHPLTCFLRASKNIGAAMFMVFC